MEIKSIEIRDISAAGLWDDMEGVEHWKALPCLSVVQALHGCYEIGLDGEAAKSTGEGGVFAAPPESMQQIIHHNGSGAYMEAQWVFMTVTLNGCYQLEDLLRLPVILPGEENDLMRENIREIRFSEDICGRYAAAYRIIGRLIALSREREQPDEIMVRLRQYVGLHYPERIDAKNLAEQAFCSVPNLYRLFRKYFNATPANYVNSVRLENAAAMLENGDESVTEIAQRTGFGDAAYFSKLFKAYFSVSPITYRRQTRHHTRIGT